MHPIRTLLAVALCPSFAAADLVDFESIPGGGVPLDDQAIGNAYNSAAFDFVTFAVTRDNGLTFEDAVFEAVGSDNVDGFVTNVNGNNDTQAPGASGPGLGNFFLRDNRGFSQTGGSLSLIITYNQAMAGNAPTEASGEIWDIDGVNGPNGTEQWEVRVTDVLGNEEVAATSPLGTTPDLPLDGLPWLFAVQDLDGIAQIELRFIGTKQSGLGVAFDNFNTSTIPAPASLALMGLGGFVAARRR